MRYRDAGLIGRMAVLASLSAACSKTPPERAAGNASPVVVADPRPLNGMRGMTAFTADSAPGMLGMMNGLSPAMQSDLASVRGADESTLHALLPHHRKMIESTLAQMNAEMRQLHMPHTTAWTALVDSIRQDLTLLEDRTGADLIRTVIENAARVERAAAMHQRMMDKHG